MSARVGAIVISVTVAALGLAAARPASGTEPVQIRWRLAHTHVTAHASDKVGFTIDNPPGHGSVVLERRGLHGWTIVDTLVAHTHADETAKGHALTTIPARGRYQFRIVVRNQSEQSVDRSAVRAVYSYDTVPMSRIAGGNGGHVIVSGKRFVYVGSGTAGLNRSLSTATCRSVAVQAAFEDQAAAGSAGTVTLRQQGRRFGKLTVPKPGKIYTTRIAVPSGSFDVLLHSKTADAIFYNGTFDCWTKSGQ